MNHSTNGTTHASTVYLPTLAEALALPIDERTEKAILLVEEGRVTVMDKHNSKVKSTTTNRKFYTVTNGMCSCKDTQYGNTPDGCAHTRAVRLQRALAQYQAVPPQDEPPAWNDADAAQEAYYAAIEEGKNHVPTPQEEAWNKAVRDFDKPATPPPAPPAPTIEPVPKPSQAVPEPPLIPEHSPSWRDKEPRFVHSLKWRDASGIEHMTVIRSDDWSDLQGDIAEASTFAMSNVARSRTEAAAPKPAAQPEAPATLPAPRQEAADEYPADPGWCSIHQCEMRRHEKQGDVWYSHRAEDDRWCKGAKKAKH